MVGYQASGGPDLRPSEFRSLPPLGAPAQVLQQIVELGHELAARHLIPLSAIY